MSPEQARGQPVDRRTDIWAFGCCLYECLSGRSAFRGKTVTDTLAAILDKDPDWSALSDGIPPIARRLLRRCLAKDMRHRLQHIGDARLELEEIGTDAGEPSARARWSFRAMPVLLAAAALVAVGAGLVSLARWTRDAAHRPPGCASGAETGGCCDQRSPASRCRLFPRHSPSPPMADGSSSGRVAKCAPNCTFESCPGSRSGRFLVPRRPRRRSFLQTASGSASGDAEDRILRKVSIAGGSPIEIGPTDVPRVAVWGSSDEIVFDTGFPKAELWSIPAGGGTAKPIAIRDRTEGEQLSLRAQLPRGNDLLVASTGPGGTWLDVLSRETGRRRRLLRGGSNIRGALHSHGASGVRRCRRTVCCPSGSASRRRLVRRLPCCMESIITSSIRTSLWPRTAR